MTTYKWDSAHDWLRDMRREGHITDDELVDFLLDVVDDDQIQDRFQSLMDDMRYFDDLDTLDCPRCGAPNTDVTTIQDHGMCLDCLHERDDDDPEPSDFELENGVGVAGIDGIDWDTVTVMREAQTGRYLDLMVSDHDYDATADHEYPPFGL